MKTIEIIKNALFVLVGFVSFVTDIWWSGFGHGYVGMYRLAIIILIIVGACGIAKACIDDKK